MKVELNNARYESRISRIIKKLGSIILTIIFATGALAETLNWFGIGPQKLSNSKWTFFMINFLNFKIPLYIVSLIILIIGIFIYRSKAKEKPDFHDSKKKMPADLEEVALSKEDKFLLLMLLDVSDRSMERITLEHYFKTKLDKTTADFNITEGSLREADLIHVLHRYSGGDICKLTSKGLKVAGRIHTKTKE